MSKDTSMSSVGRLFVVLFLVITGVKLGIAVTLPPFSDEVFWYWESLHPAWAYADIPGLTAWLIGLGVDVFGPRPIGLRIMFLLLGALLPWLAIRIARRWIDRDHAWTVGIRSCSCRLPG